MFNKKNVKAILLVIYLVTTPIGFMTDPVVKGIDWSSLGEAIAFGVPACALYFIFLVSIIALFSSNKKYIWAKIYAGAYLTGFIALQVYMSLITSLVFAHYTFEGVEKGNIIGIFLNIFNYQWALFTIALTIMAHFIFFAITKLKTNP